MYMQQKTLLSVISNIPTQAGFCGITNYRWSILTSLSTVGIASYKADIMIPQFQIKQPECSS